jgi:hypothetical protein
MADKATLTLVVLYEEEIKKAARLLEQLFNLPQDIAEVEFSKCAHSALWACRVALYHPGILDDSAIVMLTSEKALGRNKVAPPAALDTGAAAPEAE